MCVRALLSLFLSAVLRSSVTQNKRSSQKSPNERIIKIHLFSTRDEEEELFPLPFFLSFFFEFLCVVAIFLDFFIKSTVNRQASTTNVFRTNELSLAFGTKKETHKKNVVVTSVQNNNDDGSCGTVVFAKSAATTLFGDGRAFLFFFALV